MTVVEMKSPVLMLIDKASLSLFNLWDVQEFDLFEVYLGGFIEFVDLVCRFKLGVFVIGAVFGQTVVAEMMMTAVAVEASARNIFRRFPRKMDEDARTLVVM